MLHVNFYGVKIQKEEMGKGKKDGVGGRAKKNERVKEPMDSTCPSMTY